MHDIERISTLDVKARFLLQHQEIFAGAAFNMGIKVVAVPLNAVDTAGGIFAWANPEVGAIIVDRVEIDVETVATGACSISVGQAANGTTSAANLIDTKDVHSATGVFDNITDGGTNGKARQKVAAGAYVTGSKASGASAGLVGWSYIHYHAAN